MKKLLFFLPLFSVLLVAAAPAHAQAAWSVQELLTNHYLNPVGNKTIQITGEYETDYRLILFETSGTKTGCGVVSSAPGTNRFGGAAFNLVDICGGWISSNLVDGDTLSLVLVRQSGNPCVAFGSNGYQNCVNGGQIKAQYLMTYTAPPPPPPDYGPIINANYVNTNFSSTLISLGKTVAVATAGAITGLIALLGLGYTVRKIGHLLWHSDGTTNALGRHWSWYDRHTYKPYKGYNRLHSQKWNAEHTM